MKAVIIIPTFNERKNVSRLLPAIKKAIKKVKNWDIKLLVVDDNSPDGTANTVRKIAKKDKRVYLLLRKEKVGLGAAYLAGMKEAFGKMRADAVLVMDADLSHNPSYIPRFLAAVEGGSDFIVGSRYIKGGAIAKEWAPHRKFLSTFGNMIVSLVLGKSSLTDWTSGFRAVRKEVYKKVRPFISEDKAEFRGYTFNISFAHHTVSEGFRVSEVPIRFIDRTSGKSKLGMEYLLHTPLFLFKTRLKKLIKDII